MSSSFSSSEPPSSVQHASLQPSRSTLSSTTTATSQQQQQQQQSSGGVRFSSSFQEEIVEPSRRALHHFFYPNATGTTNEDNLFDANFEDSPPTTTHSPSHTTGATNTNRHTNGSILSRSTRTTDASIRSLSPPTTTTTPVTPFSTGRQADRRVLNHGLGVTPAERYSKEERNMVESVWKAYDAIVMLSLCSQLGILFRIGASKWFAYMDHDYVFNESSALFTNLPLNCVSCFLMGLLIHGKDALTILYTRHTQTIPPPPTGTSPLAQVPLHSNSTHSHGGGSPSEFPLEPGLRRRRRQQQQQPLQAQPFRMPAGHFFQTRTQGQEELREVQLAALERRIRASPSLVLFPAPKEQDDVLEHYHPDEEEEGTHGIPHHHPAPSNPNQHHSSHELQLFEIGSNDDDDDDNKDDEEDHSSTSVVSSGTQPMTLTEAGCSSYEELTIPAVAAVDLMDTERATMQHRSTLSASIPTPAATTTTTAPTSSTTRPITASSLPSTAADVTAATTSSGNQNHIQMLNDVSANLNTLSRVNIADGWDVGTTPEAMSDDLLLGLRVGFCGALSTFSSWNSSMVALMREGNFGKALVGYAIGIQLPIVAYRTGQHVALYIFVWRCRRETKRDERRGGYGLRLDDHSSCGSSRADHDDDDMMMMMMMDHNDNTLDNHTNNDSSDLPVFTFDEESGSTSPRRGSQEGGAVLRSSPSTSVSNTTATPRSRVGASSPTKRNKTTATGNNNKKRDRIVPEEATTRDTPSVRAIATALFVLSFVMQITSLVTYNTPSEQQFAISLLFSPLGVIGRWKLSQKLNSRIPGFPLGTFTCNLLSCALSGSLGTLLAGNPGPEESLVVTAMINGFAGTLSTLATFIIEILANIDPILFNFDGFIYAMVTIFWGIFIGLVTQASQNWADHI